MHKCAVLFDRFFFLANLEKEALIAEDMDRVNSLALERTGILEKAWQEREGFDENLLREQLLKAGKCQETLADAANILHKKYREQQKNGRKQNRYFNTERYINTNLQKSFYCDKVS